MWWNHVVWFCFHGEKCKKKKTKKKQKKTQHFLKSFTSYLNNRSTSEYNSTRFRKLQYRATTFIFDHFWQLIMWPPSQDPITWTLTGRIIIILFFFTFWSNQVRFPFLDGPWSSPDGSAWHPIHHSYFFQIGYHLVFLDRLPYLELDPGPWKH